MSKFNSSEVFQVGKRSIGYIGDDFKKQFGNATFESRSLGSFVKLSKTMTADQMISEGLAKECELGDVTAFLEKPPEGTKDGYSNLFILASCVVHVHWYSNGLGWDVDAWSRSDDWSEGGRVFSPATSSQNLGTGPYDSLTLAISKLTLEVERVADALEKGRKLVRAVKKVRGKKK